MSKTPSKTASKDPKTKSNDGANLKRITKISGQDLSMLPVEDKELFNKMHVEGVPAMIVTEFVKRSILKQKFQKEIKDGNFQQVVQAVGRDKYMYAKFVEVDGYQSIVDEKKFNSERACRQWLKMKKIHGLI